MFVVLFVPTLNKVLSYLILSLPGEWVGNENVAWRQHDVLFIGAR
jgi:hypothetical protein